jgi:hypothetical protein
VLNDLVCKFAAKLLQLVLQPRVTRRAQLDLPSRCCQPISHTSEIEVCEMGELKNAEVLIQVSN